MSVCVAFQLCHLLGKATLTLTQTDFGQLPDRRATGAALLAGVCVNAREQVVR